MNFFRTIAKTVLSPMNAPQGRTVRYMFPFAIGFAVILGAQAITSVESSYIRIEVDKEAVKTGERFTVGVFAYAHVPVNAVDVTLRFDSNTVEVLEVDRGQSVLTIWTEDPIVTKESVTLRGGTFRKGFLGEHKIASIDLKAKQTGNSQFTTSDVMLLAGDGKGTPVSTSESSDSKVSLYVYDSNSSPEDIGVDVTVRILTDLDGDGKITLKDISSFMGDWSNKSTIHDFNGDGKMNFRDFSIILASYFFQ